MYHRRLLPPDSGTWLLGLLTRLMVQCASVDVQDIGWSDSGVASRVYALSAHLMSKIKGAEAPPTMSPTMSPAMSLGSKATHPLELPHMNPKLRPQNTMQ